MEQVLKSKGVDFSYEEDIGADFNRVKASNQQDCRAVVSKRRLLVLRLAYAVRNKEPRGVLQMCQSAVHWPFKRKALALSIELPEPARER